MPKMKSHKASRKRFKLSASGKVKRGRPGRRHLLSHKPTKRKRGLRKDAYCPKGDAERVKRLLAT